MAQQPVFDALAQAHAQIVTQMGPSGAPSSSREELGAALVHIERALESLNGITERTKGGQTRIQSSRIANSDARSVRGTLFLILKNTLLPYLVMLPLLTVAVCLVIGLALAASEGWNVRTSLQMMISVICGLTTPLGNANNVWPTTAFGKVWMALASIWALGIAGVVIGQFGAQGLFDACHMQLLRCFGASVNGSEVRLLRNRRAIAAALVQLFVVAPLIFATFSILLGALLAAAEQWTWTTGIQYVVANVAGLPNPLVSEVPVTSYGARLMVDGSRALRLSFACPVLQAMRIWPGVCMVPPSCYHHAVASASLRHHIHGPTTTWYNLPTSALIHVCRQNRRCNHQPVGMGNVQLHHWPYGRITRPEWPGLHDQLSPLLLLEASARGERGERRVPVGLSLRLTPSLPRGPR